MNCDNARPVIDICAALFDYRRMRSCLKSYYFNRVEKSLQNNPMRSFVKFLFEYDFSLRLYSTIAKNYEKLNRYVTILFWIE